MTLKKRARVGVDAAGRHRLRPAAAARIHTLRRSGLPRASSVSCLASDPRPDRCPSPTSSDDQGVAIFRCLTVCRTSCVYRSAMADAVQAARKHRMGFLLPPSVPLVTSLTVGGSPFPCGMQGQPAPPQWLPLAHGIQPSSTQRRNACSGQHHSWWRHCHLRCSRAPFAALSGGASNLFPAVGAASRHRSVLSCEYLRGTWACIMLSN